jgi:hypothetical protein
MGCLGAYCGRFWYQFLRAVLVEKAVRLLWVILALAVLIAAMACSSSSHANGSQGPVSGNWQMTVSGVTPPTLLFTGFLSQSGGSVTGNFLLASSSNCSGVSSVTGTVNGQNTTLNIDQSGDTINLTGSLATGTGMPMTGNFTSALGICTFPSSGTWSAVQVAPIAGTFHGVFTSIFGNAPVSVTGTLTQGPNTGNSMATLSGTLATTSGSTFCAYILPGTITGLISGTGVQLSLYGENGLQYAQLGSVGKNEVTVSVDGTSLSGSYFIPALSNSCPSDQGTFSFSFP